MEKIKDENNEFTKAMISNTIHIRVILALVTIFILCFLSAISISIVVISRIIVNFGNIKIIDIVIDLDN